MKLSAHLTVVIPSKNEEKLILQTLKSLNDQVGTADLRVIIADCSSDNTRNLISDFMHSESNHLNIEIIQGGLPSVARNNGASQVTTDYVLFLDADMYFCDHNHLYKEFNKMAKCDIELLTCKLRTASFFYDIAYSVFELFQRAISVKEPFAVGGYMLFKKTAFDKLKGFNVEDKFAEDFSLSRKISPSKFTITRRIIYTSPRRLKSKGIFWMAKLMTETWFKRNQASQYRNDHGYWN